MPAGPIERCGGTAAHAARPRADLRRAYPGVPAESFEVVGITIQSDSDESRGKTEVYLDQIRFTPRPAGQE